MEDQKDFEFVRNEIAIAAKAVFIKYGYAKVSMDDIAKAFGKSRTTLYHYFKNKKEIFERIAIDHFRDTLIDAEKTIDPAKTVEENLGSYYRKRFSNVRILTGEYSAIVQEIVQHEDVFNRLTKIQFVEEIDIVEKIFGWAVKNDEIPLHPQKKLRFLAEVLVTSVRSFEHDVILKDNPEVFNEKLEWLIRIYCKGIK